MSHETTSTKYTGSKPLQSLSYGEKIKDEKLWGKQNIDYNISCANFGLTNKETGGHIVSDWYNAYNGKLGEDIFDYVTNPLNTKEAKYKSFPAKIRNYNIIRSNIDLLIGEWCKRRFKFDVINLDGDDVFNSFLTARYDKFKKNLSQRFVNTLNTINQDSQQSGLPTVEIPDPQTILEELNTNYRDLKAIKGYKALKTLEFELKLKEVFKSLIKDWLIAGKVSTVKFPKFSEIEYSRISPIDTDVHKSPNERNFEDGEVGTVRFRVTVSDLVDLFYDELSETQLKRLEEDENSYRSRLWLFLGGSVDQNGDKQGKANLFYSCWKSRRKIGILTYVDETTLETMQLEVDEDYKVDKTNGESVEWMWVNQVWEGWRVNDDLYLGIQPCICQREEANRKSSCKLPINGRRFSDVESENISIVSLGIPYQIFYIILMYRIELAIAKSKGKILVLDKNVVPDDDEGGEEKFFYYSEAMGYMLIDRNQDGVDRSFNQYQSVDMNQYDSISQLINLANYFKGQYEEMLGITRQRKGQNNSSDGLGVTEQSIFRSTVISEIVFSDFDEFCQSELQGLLDNSNLAWIDGKKGYYQNDDGRLALLSLEADETASLSLGTVVDSMGATADKLDNLKNQINAFAQRKDVKMSTIADIIFTDSYAEITAKLKTAEKLEMQIAQQQAQNENDLQERQGEIQKQYAEFEHMLAVDLQEKEWDRKDNNEYIKGQMANLTTPLDDHTEDSLQQTMLQIEEQANKRLDRMSKERIESAKLKSDDMNKRLDRVSKEKIETMKNLTNRIKARQKPTSSR